MRTALFGLLAVQAGIALLAGAAFYLHAHSITAAEAALYGGGIGMGASALLGYRVLRAARPGAGLGGLYIGALERFIFVGAAFAVGLAVLKLAPVAMIVGFGGAQCAYFITARWANRREAGQSGGQHGGG
ncbi:MAG TPA: ATP synthase subunit I [Gammaproteobacteria bacterium]|nr:ATP synthase subunit I [Gammaproteobacteria bacterium]